MFSTETQIGSGRLSTALFVLTIVAASLLPVAALIEHDTVGDAALVVHSDSAPSGDAAAWEAVPSAAKNS